MLQPPPRGTAAPAHMGRPLAIFRIPEKQLMLSVHCKRTAGGRLPFLPAEGMPGLTVSHADHGTATPGGQ